MGLEDAALGAIRILTHGMVQAIELNSVRKGYDPRDFALVAFGGGGPLFACDIAAELSIPMVIIPPNPGLTSALGLLATDIAYDFSRTELVRASRIDPARLAEHFAALEAQAKAQLEADRVEPKDMLFQRIADCRYVGQGYEIRTPLPSGPIDAAIRKQVADAFHAAHQRDFGRFFADKDVEVVNIRVVGIGKIRDLQPRRLDKGTATPPPAAVTSTRPVVWARGTREWDRLDTPHYDRSKLLAGNRVAGPAIIEQPDSTTPIPPGRTAVVDDYGNLLVDMT
jgi:N-methylhydantoinase A/oxoprolinase/acetone carboxylase beta subunit